MVECGMSPAEALVATTRTAAELLGIAEHDRHAGAGEGGRHRRARRRRPRRATTSPARVRRVYQDGALVSEGPP